MLYFEQSGQTGVENGAMLTTYLFRYTSECTISLSNFQSFFRLRWQGGTDPLTKILRTLLPLIEVDNACDARRAVQIEKTEKSDVWSLGQMKLVLVEIAGGALHSNVYQYSSKLSYSL